MERGDYGVAAESLHLGEGAAHRLEMIVQEIGESVKEYSRIGQREGSISSDETAEPTDSSPQSSGDGEEDDDDESIVFILERPGTEDERDRRWTW